MTEQEVAIKKTTETHQGYSAASRRIQQARFLLQAMREGHITEMAEIDSPYPLGARGVFQLLAIFFFFATICVEGIHILNIYVQFDSQKTAILLLISAISSSVISLFLPRQYFR